MENIGHPGSTINMDLMRQWAESSVFNDMTKHNGLMDSDTQNMGDGMNTGPLIRGMNPDQNNGGFGTIDQGGAPEPEAKRTLWDILDELSGPERSEYKLKGAQDKAKAESTQSLMGGP